MRHQNITLAPKKVLSTPLMVFLMGCALLPWLLHCGGLPAGAPLVRDFDFVRQALSDPRRFCFKIEWRDQEGDLFTAAAQGEIRLTIAKTEGNQPPLSLSPIKINASLPGAAMGSTEGLFDDICVDIREETGNWPNQLKFTVQLIDAVGNASNKAWVIIQIKT